MEAERKRKREAASDLIAAMLDADQAEEPAVEPAEERRRKLLEEAEEARKRQEARIRACERAVRCVRHAEPHGVKAFLGHMTGEAPAFKSI